MKLNLKNKIWITVSSIVLAFSYFLLIFFPNRQLDNLLTNFNKEVQNLANTVSLGVKIAMTEQNFEGVQTALDFVKADNRLIFVAIVGIDTVFSDDGESFTTDTTKFISFPQDYKFDNRAQSSADLVLKRSGFQTGNMNGQVVVGLSTVEIRENDQEIRFVGIIISSFVFGFGILMGFFLARNISNPVLELRDVSKRVGEGDFSQRIRFRRKDEIGELGAAFNKMIGELEIAKQQVESSLEEIQQNQEEILSQRDDIKRKSENLSLLNRIGHSITSSLETDTIIQIVYENLSRVMDVTGFKLGMYDQAADTLTFESYRDGLRRPTTVRSARDKNFLSTWCLENEEAIRIGDFEKEHTKFIPQVTEERADLYLQSVMYVPLTIKNKKIGVMAVEHEEKHVFSDYQFNLFGNLATYTATALDKALAYRLVEKSNLKINDSIRYAKRIQTAILPKTESLKTIFPDSFVFFRPRDVVSGDFYYCAEQDGKHILAAIDCTGHGVPGGFMSMIGYSLLNQIIYSRQFSRPADILMALHEGVVKGLNQAHNQVQDGMDAVLCSVDLENNKLEMAGAHNSLYLFNKDTEIRRFRGDNLSVGGRTKKQIQEFTNQETSLQTGDTIYLFSDGYADQTGGPKNKKYLIKRFRNFLLSIQDQTMDEQKRSVGKEITFWQGTHQQIDDMLVMGVRFKF